MRGATLKFLRRCALSRWSCNCPHLCKSNWARGCQSISTKFRSGNDLSATEYEVKAPSVRGVAIARLTDEPGHHLSLRWQRLAAATPVGDESQGDPHLGLVSSRDEAHGAKPIWQRSGAV